MLSGKIITSGSKFKELFQNSGTIAIIGLSPKPERDSYKVAEYLKRQGYRIIPVRPGQKEILGEKAYSSIDKIREPVDIVVVFRSPDQVLPHAQEALRLKPQVFWMQLNIENIDASNLLTSCGIDVVINRCIKMEHEALFS